MDSGRESIRFHAYKLNSGISADIGDFDEHVCIFLLTHAHAKYKPASAACSGFVLHNQGSGIRTDNYRGWKAGSNKFDPIRSRFRTAGSRRRNEARQAEPSSSGNMG